MSGNPASAVPRIAEFETVRDRVLSDDELRALWNRLDELRAEVALTFRCAILLGGQRFRQLLRATWRDYDEDARVLTLLDAKGRRKSPMPHVLPISKRVAAMIKQLRGFNENGSHIFSTNGGKTPIHTATLSTSFANEAHIVGLIDHNGSRARKGTPSIARELCCTGGSEIKTPSTLATASPSTSLSR